jgi:ligand-binding sensor domain-containing protein/uncharacterized membrane-anchored protein YhcB (DUF1043 family)
VRWSRNHKPKTRFLWTLVFVIAFIGGIAQSPNFKLLEVANKRAHLHIFEVHQVDEGYLLLGTNKGLMRYDGVRYLEYDLPDSLKSTNISHISVQGELILVGFENGVFLSFQLKKEREKSIWKLSDSEITSAKIAKDGSIWVGTEGEGLFRILNGVSTKFTTEDGLPDNYIHCLEIMKDRLMIGTDLGLATCSTSAELSSVQFDIRNSDSGLSDNLVMSFCLKDDDHLILGMQNGTISVFQAGNNQISTFSALNNLGLSSIEHLHVLQNDIVAITSSDGAMLINWSNPTRLQQFDLTNENQLKPIEDCLVDKEGNLIIADGTHILTLADFRIQFIVEHDGQPFYDSHCVLYSNAGDILFANSNGIFLHKTEFTKDQFIKPLLSTKPGDAAIISLCEDSRGRIWFGTFGDGLGVIDVQTGKIVRFSEKDGVLNNNVLSMTFHQDKVWLATLGGAGWVEEINGEFHFQSYDRTSPLASSYVYSVYASSKGELWFGTDGNGAAKYDSGEFIFLRNKYDHLGKSVVSITEDVKGNIWFYSSDKGLQWMDDKGLYDFPLSVDSENIEIYAIQGDPLGNIVALSSLGLAIINYKSDHISFYLPERDVSSNYVNVITRDYGGQLWIGTTEAMIKFVEVADAPIKKPHTLLENISVMLLPIDSSEHTFAYDKNHFTFDISSIWFQRPELINFECKLEGFDLDWVKTRDRTVVYPSLPPGNYRFLVRSSANENWADAEFVSWSFKINKPFWETWWFISGIILLITVSISAVMRIRLNYIRRRESISRQKVQSQFETLRNQVNPHFLFNSFNTLISTIEQDPEEAVNYVERLSDYFRVVLEQRDKDVITLKEELELVRNYLFLQQKRFGSNLDYSIRIKDETLKSLVPPMTIQILLENAIKHNVISRQKPLRIEIVEENGILQIRNNLQPKLLKEPSTGIGLENVKNRYKILFDRSISIRETSVSFVVDLPIQTVTA